MDTPERSNVGTTLSTFEDSPVFSFLNSLSPIKPIKSSHSLQTFNSLNFASLQSVFTSPHVNQKKESKSSVSQTLVDCSKHENSLEEIGDPQVPVGEPGNSNASVVSLDNYVNSTISLSEPVEFEPSSPKHNSTPSFALKQNIILDLDCTPVELVHSILDGCGRRTSSFATKVELQNKLKELVENENEGPECGHENLISDYASKPLVFQSFCESEVLDESSEQEDVCNLQILSSSRQELGEDVVDDSNRFIFESFDPYCQSETYFPTVKHNEKFIEEDKNVQTSQMVSENCLNQHANSNLINETIDQAARNSTECQIDAPQQRGILRRCLVFEVSKNNFENEIEFHPETPLGPSGQCSSNGTWAVSSKPSGNHAPYVLPGIGLHLNALAIPSNASAIHLLGGPQSINLLPPITSGQSSQRKVMSVGKDVGLIGGEITEAEIVDDEASQGSTIPTGEENSSSPKRKRRKSDVGEDDACKRCNCKKSKCLKLYCECFAAGVYCVEPCSCNGCLNKPIHEEIVLSTRKLIESRNPIAFAPKVILASETAQETSEDSNKIPASARHKRGCNCKKSNCLKKYCECYQGGVGCSASCRCRSCKNAFGVKDGTLPSEDENVEHEEQGFATPKNEEGQSPDCSLPIIPLRAPRHPAIRRSHSTGKPPKSSTTPRLKASKSPTKSGVPLLAEFKLEKNTPSISSAIAQDDDMPEILTSVASPSNTVKNASPNQKRVLPPHKAVGLSPFLRKGCRKLILKSIPPFPSLNTNPVDQNPLSSSTISVDPPHPQLNTQG